MPYVFRDELGAIVKASVRPIHGAEVVPHGDPKLIEFVESRGVVAKEIEKALSELRQSDLDMTRAIEDVIMALLKKNILKLSDLPKAVQDRMANRVKLRAMIAEAYDRASSSRPISI